MWRDWLNEGAKLSETEVFMNMSLLTVLIESVTVVKMYDGFYVIVFSLTNQEFKKFEFNINLRACNYYRTVVEVGI